MQATGPPESAYTCSDVPTNWAPLEGGPEPEWLEITLGQPVYPSTILIWEAVPGAFVERVELRGADGVLREAWSGVDTTACGTPLHVVPGASEYLASGVRIHTRIEGWEEIDAVEVAGLDVSDAGPPTPDGVGDACDACPELYNPTQVPLVFGAPIRALDRGTWSWPFAAPIDFVRGSLAEVATYAVLASGTLGGATTLDMSADVPAPGGGLYYLVKLHAGCGTWQTAAGAEPARDAVLP